jgi:AraC-like DNA-binding protein
MAGRANSLTEDVTAKSGGGAPAMIAAGNLRVLIAGLTRLGFDVAPLLSAAGLSESDLAGPDAMVACAANDRVFIEANRQRQIPNLMLELAQVTPLGAFPLLDYLVITSDTVGDGLRQLAQYFRLSGSPVTISIEDSGDPVQVRLIAASSAAPAVEFLASLMVLHLRRETDGRFAASAVSFQHQPEDPAGFERVLGCPVRTNTVSNGVAIGAAVFRLPMVRRDSVLRQVLETQANEILARLPSRAGLAAEVQRVLSTRVAGGDVRIDAVARQLAISGRTLQRRLAAEGVSYQDLLDEARKESAGRHLAESVFAIGEVAYLVGYSEPAPFYRAFKRWYGVTPEAFRQAKRRP